MPMTLDSTAPLRGQTPKRRWTLVVASHGRWEYLGRAMESLTQAVGDEFFDRTVLSIDGTPYQFIPVPFIPTPSELHSTGSRQGLTANLAQAWGALTDEDEWVFHLEEDFLVHDAPLDAMADALEANPQVANMVLLRQPWGAHEIAAGSVLKAQPYDLHDAGGWLEHEGGFWLNPFVAKASLLRSLTPGVETELTRQCLERGYSFGYWGGLDDPPRCEHIGAEGGMGSPGWRP